MSPPVETTFGKLLRLNAAERAALARAGVVLAQARITLAGHDMRQILEDITSSPDLERPAGDDHLNLIRWAISTAAPKLPWRADCLVQTIAAARWLRRENTPWTVSIGVRRNPAGELEAHAWLSSAGIIITGELPDLASFRQIPLDQFNTLNLPIK